MCEREAKVTAINEMQQKYGTDTPLFEVALLELMELTEILYEYRQSINGEMDSLEDIYDSDFDEGVGFWEEA